MTGGAIETLKHQLSDYPADALDYFDAGFAEAGRLPDETRALVLQALIDGIRRGRRRVTGKVLIGQKGLEAITPRGAERLTSVYSLVIGLLSETTVTPDDFATTASGVLFKPDNELVARSIASAICTRRAEIDEVVARAQLLGAVLPSLEKFNIEVDIRVRMADGKIKVGAPVLVAQVDTSQPKNSFALQLTRADAEDLQRSLTKALEDLQAAEQNLAKLR